MNIWTGLLFLEGAIADTPLARELSGDDTAASPRDTATADAESRGAASAAAH